MPTRSLNSSILKWPDSRAVETALRDWIEPVISGRSDVLHIGYFGSYANDRWGVGSDLDIIIIVENSDQSFENRARQWDGSALPVPAEILIYTLAEWKSFDKNSRFYQMLKADTVWLFNRKTTEVKKT